MLNLNEVTIAGRVTKVEINKTKGDKDVVTLTIVTSEYYEKDGQKEEKAEWHRVVVWGKTAEYVAKYVKVKDVALVKGKISTNKWQDKDGNNRTTTEIIASTVQVAPNANKAKENETKSENKSGFSLED
jgi:single-strand DNA-binding protein